MKILSSFRLSPTAKQNLERLANKHKLSQAELIEVMSDFVDKPDLEYEFKIAAGAFKTEKNPAFKKFKAEYDKLSIPEQKIMWQKLMENGFKFEE